MLSLVFAEVASSIVLPTYIFFSRTMSQGNRSAVSRLKMDYMRIKKV